LTQAMDSIEMVSEMCPDLQIGIITHVKELSDRFTSRLEVKAMPCGDREINILN